MMKQVGLKSVCKGCAHVFKTASTLEALGVIPPSCEKCKGDMCVEPVFEEDKKGRTYEFTIFCKETAAMVRDGMTLSNDEIKADDATVQKMFQYRASEAFLKMINANKNAVDQKNVKKLLRG